MPSTKFPLLGIVSMSPRFNQSRACYVFIYLAFSLIYFSWLVFTAVTRIMLDCLFLGFLKQRLFTIQADCFKTQFCCFHLKSSLFRPMQRYLQSGKFLEEAPPPKGPAERTADSPSHFYVHYMNILLLVLTLQFQSKCKKSLFQPPIPANRISWTNQ